MNKSFPFQIEGGEGPNRAATLECSFCPASLHVHLGEGTVDIARLATAAGYQLTPDGRVGCGKDCATKGLRHTLRGDLADESADYSFSGDEAERRLLASRGQAATSATRFISTGTASTDRVELHERALRVACRAPGCQALQIVDQRRTGENEWTPAADPFLAMLGWRPGPFCSTTCAHRCGIDARIEAAQKPVVAVQAIADASYQASRARALAAVSAPPATRFESELAARSQVGEPRKPAAKVAR